MLYEGGYTLGVQEIKAHQTLMVDFLALRDAQTPDAIGNVIPMNIGRGQIGWTSKGAQNHIINGRSEQFSESMGLASTYDCRRNCCPDTYSTSWISPDGLVGYVGDTDNLYAFQQDENCYGQVYPPYYASLFNWASSDLAVATIGYASGATEAVGVGTATLRANILADVWMQAPLGGQCEHSQIRVTNEIFDDVLASDVAFQTARIDDGLEVANFQEMQLFK